MARTSPRWCLAVVALGFAGVAACGGGDGSSGACGPITREALDPSFLVHVLGDEEGLEYTSDPPTSGPHQPTPPVEGVVDEVLPRPVQVGILEQGDILIQYDPDLDDASITTLEDLAVAHVVVAPNPDLPDPVVGTAWVYKRTCRSADAAALQELVDERVGKGPDG